MMTRRVVLFALTLFASSLAFGQLPPGKWWRRPDIVQNLSLTEDQQNRLELIFRDAASDLIDTRGQIEKDNIALRGELDRPQLDRVAIRRIAQHLSAARGRQFERELMMLADMRAVLSDPQWNRMRNELDRLQQARPRQR